MENNQQLPNPTDPPQPIPDNWVDKLVVAGGAISLVSMIGGAFLSLVVASMGTRVGSTRSMHLQWEERQTEIQKVIEAEKAPLPANDSKSPD